MTTPGQVTISGETISGARLKVSELTVDTLPEGMTWDQFSSLGRKDRMRIEVEVILTRSPSVVSKYDAESGDETGDITGELVFKPLREGFKVLAIQTASAREAAWHREHTA